VSLLIAIEGIDGSGKGTQAARLVERLRHEGHRCELLSFPRYRETQFGRKIGDFLNGRFGQLDQVSPFLVSLLFAGDRFESKPVLLRALAENDIVVCDRYVASNVAHQSAKVAGAEREELIEWVRSVEFSLYELPCPTRTIFLDLPVEQATTLIALKAQRTYTDRAEADAAYLQRVHGVYAELASNDASWLRINCLDNRELKTVDRIAEEVWQAVQSVMKG
jgi:dTMP kinase